MIGFRLTLLEREIHQSDGTDQIVISTVTLNLPPRVESIIIV